MYQKPLKIDDLNPDKIKIVVSWGDMVIGASVFIPCIDTQKAKEQVQEVAERNLWQVTARVRIESGMFGVRIWRIV